MRKYLTLALAIVPVRWSTVHAQTTTTDLVVSAVAAKANHYLLSSTLHGAALGLRINPSQGRYTINAVFENARGRARRTGAPCGGLVEPGSCPAELVNDDGQTYALSTTAGLRVLGDRYASLAVQAGYGIAVMRAETTGLTSGRRISTSQVMRGPRLGIDTRWVPSARAPVALQLTVTRSWWGRFRSNDSVDGYSPFDNGEVAQNSAQLGVAVRLPRRRVLAPEGR